VFQGSLATSIATSFVDLAKKIFQELNKDNVEIIGTPNTPEGVFSRVGDVKKIHEMGFAHNIKIDDGIKHTLKSMDENRSIYDL
jgi:nucleoside-diphosphate-sugar epimerase